MTARIIDGKAFADRLATGIAAAVPTFAEAAGRPPGLAVVLVGSDPASEIYVANKVKKTIELGMASTRHVLPTETTQDELLALVAELNADDNVDGILVQLPLPAHIDAQRIIAAIDPDKDVDGLHVVSAGRLTAGLPGLVSCTPYGCLLLLRDALGDLSGLEAVVIGRSVLVGKPMAQLLVAANCTVTMAHSHTRNLADIVRRADIVIAATGRAEMVKGDWIKPGATVIDVGTTRIVRDGKRKLLGDVEFETARLVAGAITPVPGGVGPMTIITLLHNTLQAAHSRAGLPAPVLA